MIDKLRAGLVSHLEVIAPPEWEDSRWPLEDPRLGGR